MRITENVDMYGHKHLEKLHENKKGTPTMGGILIVVSVFLASFLCNRWDNIFVWYSILAMLLLAMVGLRDDFLKVKNRKGLTRREKLFFQLVIGVGFGIVISLNQDVTPEVFVPFFKNMILNLGVFHILWTALVIVSFSNAVNFTDGLDGLAIGGVVSTSAVLAILSYVSGHRGFSDYLFIPFIKDAGELSIICVALLGAGLGFLWFNAYPAQVFMGDVGALSLGGVIGIVSILVKKELVLVIAGGIFVLEALSVVIQIASIRLRNKKVFRAAPFHHHLQIIGWPESKIVVRMWIVSLIFAVISLLTLKLR